MLEGDLLLSTFAAENLPRMSLEELKEFDRVCLSNGMIVFCRTDMIYIS